MYIYLVIVHHESYNEVYAFGEHDFDSAYKMAKGMFDDWYREDDGMRFYDHSSLSSRCDLNLFGSFSYSYFTDNSVNIVKVKINDCSYYKDN